MEKNEVKNEGNAEAIVSFAKLTNGRTQPKRRMKMFNARVKIMSFILYTTKTRFVIAPKTIFKPLRKELKRVEESHNKLPKPIQPTTELTEKILSVSCKIVLIM